MQIGQKQPKGGPGCSSRKNWHYSGSSRSGPASDRTSRHSHLFALSAAAAAAASASGAGVGEGQAGEPVEINSGEAEEVSSVYEEVLNMNPMQDGKRAQAESAERQRDDSGDAEDTSNAATLPDVEEWESLSGPFVIRFPDSKGNQIVLTPMSQSHAPGYFREVSTNRGLLEVWLPSFRNAYKSVQDTNDIIQQELEWTNKAKCIRWSVLVNGNIKGNVGLNVIDWKNKVGYLGYWLSKDAQGRGIVSRSVSEVIKFGFEYLGLEHMDISARRQNVRSAAVARRLGFEKQDDIEDNEPGVKFPLDVFTLSRSGDGFKPRKPASDAREEFFLVNALGYFGRKESLSFDIDTKMLHGELNLFSKLFGSW